MLTASLIALAALSLAWVGVRRHRPWYVLGDALLFSLYTLVLAHLLVSPLNPHFDPSSKGPHFLEQLLEAVWCLLATHLAVGVGRVGFSIDRWPAEKRQLPDILSGLVYLAGFLAFIDFVFAIPVQGLLATSGLVAIIFGLALQSTLSDVFSGIAVRIERPYDLGDFICVDTLAEGTVSQVNWRSTHIRTVSNDIAIIPNSIVAKSRLTNRTLSPMSRERFCVALGGAVVPEDGKAVLARAASLCPSILTEPAPDIVCTQVAADRIQFELWFAVADRTLIRTTHDALCSNVVREARAANIELAAANSEEP